MPKKIEIKPTVAMATLLLSAATSGLALYLFTNIDNIIHNTLYDYGLQFNDEWANPYWNNSRPLTIALIFAITLFVLSTVLLAFYAKKHSKTAKAISFTLVVMGLLSTVSSFYFFNNITTLVSGNILYKYGLIYRTDWANPYLTYAGLFAPAIIIAGLLSSVSSGLIIASRRSIEITSTKIIAPTLAIPGAIGLTYSVISSNSTLAFVGLGLIFYGIILTYVRTDNYSKRVLMDTTILSQKSTINQILNNLSFTGKPVYLPPKYFINPETSKIYIPRKEGNLLPTPELIQKEENELYITTPPGLLLTPIGAGLSNLFEKTLETNFTKINFQYLQQNLPKIIIDELEMAQTFQIRMENKKIRVEAKNSIFNHPPTKENQAIYEIESPLTSAIACSLAKATGQPIKLDKIQTKRGGKDITIDFNVMSEEMTYP